MTAMLQKTREAQEHAVQEGWHSRSRCRTLPRSHGRQVV